MKLKKINQNLLQALQQNGYESVSPVLQDAFGTIKSGNDVVLIIENDADCYDAIAISVIQRLEKPFMLSPRALVVVKDKEQALKMEEVFKKLAKYTELRIFMTHEKTDLDEDKNLISVGIDVLIGTPERLALMLSTAGYDVNQLKMWVINDTDELLRLRHDTKLYRLSESIGKTQRLYVAKTETERLETFVDKTMLDSYWFANEDFYDEDDEVNEE